MSVATIEPEALVVAEPTLAELAATANREHNLARQAHDSFLQHAISAGHALIAARRQVPSGGWTTWVTRHFKASRATACKYVKLAEHEALVLEETGSTNASITRAYAVLPPGGQSWKYDKTIHDQAIKMRKDGATYKAIADELGISKSVAVKWNRPGAYAIYVRKADSSRQVRATLRRTDAETRIKQKGGTTAHAYASVRRAAQDLDRAITDVTDTSARKYLTEALARLYTAEDLIVKAVGIE